MIAWSRIRYIAFALMIMFRFGSRDVAIERRMPPNAGIKLANDGLDERLGLDVEQNMAELLYERGNPHLEWTAS